jgi:two-component system cell cycle response regulator
MAVIESPTITILLIEDNPGDARLIREFLTESRLTRFTLVNETRLGAGLMRLKADAIDAVVLDLSLPDSAGLDTVERVHTECPQVPLVVLTGREDEELGIRAVQVGAEDYLVKGKVDGDLLRRSLRYAIERHRLREELRVVSLIDDLTGLYNRRGFLTMAAQQLKLAGRTGRPPLLLFADVDSLKRINDTCGHREGDQALRQTAEVLRATFRRSDILARIGGDEFVVLAWEPTRLGAGALERRLAEMLALCNAAPERTYSLSLSTGIIAYPTDRTPPIEEVLAQADAAMYKRRQERRAGLAEEE